jgi:hypothetical protein
LGFADGGNDVTASRVVFQITPFKLRVVSQLQLKISDGRSAFSPGETITGTAAWQLDAPPEKAELNLIWSTRGKGTQDIEIVITIPFPNPQTSDHRPFTIKLPSAPYTFSGHLISLVWTLELGINPGDHCEALELTIAPGGKEVLLPRI